MTDEKKADVRISIGIPTGGTCNMKFTGSLVCMISSIASNGIRTMPEASVEVGVDIVGSTSWIANREQIVKNAIAADKTHILWLDDDMVFHPAVVDSLMGRRLPIVATNYLIKTEPEAEAQFVAVSLDGKHRVVTHEGSTGLMPIAYSGFGVSVFDVNVFKAIPQPWFLPDFIPEKGEYTTEDNPLFRKAREAGFQPWLDQDASKLVSHVGAKEWRWQAVKL